MDTQQSPARSAMCTRRDFVRMAGALGVGAALPGVVLAHSVPETGVVSLHVGLLSGRSAHADVARGFQLGVEEAARAAQLFHGGVVADTGASLQALARSGCTAIVGAVSEALAAAGAQREASRRGLLYLNVGARADSLRTGECGELAFHVVASDAMRQVSPASGGLVAWHPRLRRFGAEQLNDRYAHRFARDMSEEAWFGWMAAKVAWEAAVRARAVRGRELAAVLRMPATGFDGHKGRALRFNPTDRQLYYPVYALPSLGEVQPGAQPLTAHGHGRCGT